ncbi:MAG TPA: sigma-70 family RNA polymerase sigma factor [Pirellulales bacterium]|nr:sigma-70 family RNA polymerase sigma factor [Pirellulales bacterium]
MHTTPVSLLLRLKEPGDEQAWLRFVDLYTPLLFHWARQKGLRAPDDADFVQDIFVALVEKLPQFEYDPRKSFRGWLYTLVLNKWRDRSRRIPPVGQSLNVELDDQPGPPGPAADRFVEEEHNRYLAARALAIMQVEFPETTWKACWEFVARERPAQEVAAELGIAESSVYVAKCRVIRRLRQELEGMWD